MLDSLFDFIQKSPNMAYTIVFLGALIEGELIILSASALAAAGYLSIAKVSSIAFFTTLFIDQVLFYVGHYMYKHPGRPLSERYPRLYQRSKRAVLYLKKYDTLFILSFRFVYGIRAISPVVIGLCGSTPKRFVPLNFVSALVWTAISCGAGYCFGDFFFDAQTGHLVNSSVHKLQGVVIGVVLLAIVLIVLFRLKGKILKKNSE
ncbi:MAG: VTT domain-containing protein [Holosporales bacterium]|jgi:membrane protein DedA with SNARE-associated domain|nr:VTT domain-containing protein [Holosporales bacterium]